MKRFITAKVILVASMIIWQMNDVSAQCSQWNAGPSPKCSNDTAFLLTGGTPSPGVYFGPGVNAGYFDPTLVGPGNYTLGFTASGCVPPFADTAYVIVVVNQAPTATLSGLDTAYCENAVPQVITPSGTPISGTLTGPGVVGGNFNIGLAGPGFHTIKYFFMNASSCTDTAYAPVHVRALPNVTLVIPTSAPLPSPPNQKFVCELDGVYPIWGNSPPASPPTGYFTGNIPPSPGIGVDSATSTFDPDPSILGWNVVNYTYTDGQCTASAVDSIFVQNNPAVTVIPYFSPCANGDPFLLTQGNPVGGIYSGTGVTGAGPYYFDPSVTGSGIFPIEYCFTAANGCETCVTQNIEVKAIPIITFNPIPGLCENTGPIYLLDYTDPDTGYFIGPGVGLDSLTLYPSTMGGPGSYSITFYALDTATGCGDTSTQLLTINPKPYMTLTSSPLSTPNPPPDSANLVVKICKDYSANILYTSIPSASFTFEPSLFITYNPGNVDLYPDTNFYYDVVARGSNGCFDTGSVQVIVIQPAAAVISGDMNICYGDTTKLTASGANTYQWIDPSLGAADIFVSPKYSREYEVVALSDLDGNGNQCTTDTTKTTVTVNPLPRIRTSIDTTIFLGDATMLKGYGGRSYIWSALDELELSCLNCNTPIATPIYNDNVPDVRVYVVIGTDSNGCSNTDSITITLKPDIIIFVPSGFSPNNDGYNDELFVESKGIETIDFEIYDRYGRTVFASRNLEEGWDGKFDGELLNKDVYFYNLKATPFKSGLPIEQAGQISLIR